MVKRILLLETLQPKALRTEYEVTYVILQHCLRSRVRFPGAFHITVFVQASCLGFGKNVQRLRL